MRLLSLPGFVLAFLTICPAVAQQVPLQQPYSPSSNDYDSSSIKLPSTPLLDLHRNLVEIDSVTGKEEAVGQYLISYLRDLNLTIDTQNV